MDSEVYQQNDSIHTLAGVAMQLHWLELLIRFAENGPAVEKARQDYAEMRAISKEMHDRRALRRDLASGYDPDSGFVEKTWIYSP